MKKKVDHPSPHPSPRLSGNLDAPARPDDSDVQGTSSQSANWSRVLADVVDDAVVVLDREWRLVYANKAAERFLGVSGEHLTFERLLSIVPGTVSSPFLAALQQVMSTRVPIAVSEEFTLHGQDDLWFQGRVFPVPEGVLAIAADITERKRGEAAFGASEHRFRSLFENSMDAIIIASADGTILEANQAWLNMFRYSRDDLPALNAGELYVDTAVRDQMPSRVAEAGTVSDEVRYRRKDGSVFDAQQRVMGVTDNEGKVTLYQGIIYDKTELAQAEYRERDQRGFAAALMETSPACILVFDIDLHVVFANAESDRVLGIPREQIVGMTSGKDLLLMDAEGRPIPEEELPACRVFKSETPMYGVEYAFDSPSGRRTLSISAAPLLDDTSAVTRVVASIEDITARKQMEEDLWRSIDTRAALNEILELSLADIPLQSMLERSLIHILSIPWFEFEQSGAIFLVEDEPGVLVMKAQLSLAEPIQAACARVPFDRCLCGRAALTKEPQFADCIDSRHEIMYAGIHPHGHYCVPILFDAKVRGVIVVYIGEGHRRDNRALAFLSAVANTLAGIIERRRREQEREEALVRVQTALTTTVQVMSSAVELRDPYTAGHQSRVSIVARAIAEEMGLPAESLDAVEVAGRVHDLGKLRIPAEILTKPSKLTAVEYELIKEHPQASYDLLKGIDFPWPIAAIAYEHHERIDGSGYPQGLKGDEMLPEARILAVADVFEAMSSHRPYRPTLGVEAALEELRSRSGVLYDSAAVDALVHLVRDKGFKLES